MFTGIIEEVGRVPSVSNQRGGRRLIVEASQVTRELREGDSVAVSGVCLTALEITPSSFAADLAQETWDVTSFSRIKKGALVNLELPLRANGRFGGHIVQGHVDGMGKLIALDRLQAGDYRLHVEIPAALARYVISRGSLSIEGVSLTVAKIEDTQVEVAIIPHTIEMTNLKSLRPGDPVNLEVDLVAKYIEKMMGSKQEDSRITLKRLVAEGF
ncbi:MAG: riboflavin synthase [Acidobacteriota bacterium]|nr:riboflavin synthase [Acidobacteriota bacterium]